MISTTNNNELCRNTVELTTLDCEAAKLFYALTEAQLRNESEQSQGIFIAESPKVIRVALDAGYEPIALLCERRHIEGDAKDIIERFSESVTVYTGERELLQQITGYKLTRGVLCAFRRKELPTLDELFSDDKSLSPSPMKRIVVIDQVCDTTNIGAIFRSAAALGMDAVILTKGSCDPLNRRSIRVSMGSVFLIPWTWIDGEITPTLNRYGFKTVAMALTDKSIPLDSEVLLKEDKLALIMGTEGDGLAKEVISAADYTVRIPMYHGVDSLNVAAASAVAFWQLRPRQGQQ